MAGHMRQAFAESANAKALRGLMIGLAALVVLAVSGYGTVIYIQLMGKVFPSGPLLMACYMGAFANVVLMLGCWWESSCGSVRALTRWQAGL